MRANIMQTTASDYHHHHDHDHWDDDHGDDQDDHDDDDGDDQDDDDSDDYDNDVYTVHLQGRILCVSPGRRSPCGPAQDLGKESFQSHDN